PNAAAQTKAKRAYTVLKPLEPGDTDVAVYTSSRAGDRISRNPDTKFITNTTVSAPEIAVDEKNTYQKIEGVGATFNEAGMMCLNALPIKERDSVFGYLFDP